MYLPSRTYEWGRFSASCVSFAFYAYNHQRFVLSNSLITNAYIRAFDRSLNKVALLKLIYVTGVSKNRKR